LSGSRKTGGAEAERSVERWVEDSEWERTGKWRSEKSYLTGSDKTFCFAPLCSLLHCAQSSFVRSHFLFYDLYGLHLSMNWNCKQSVYT